jgi:8-oxo-dGTP pyrophosphatase MutT (NUDIX family)
MELREQIRRTLGLLKPKRLAGETRRQAAVLMLIFERNGMPHFLLTRRTEEVSTHKGQISFPGGMSHKGESLEQTALRETFEEVGIETHRIEILGRFHDYLSISGHLVAPFAGYIEGTFATVPQNREVAEILQVPFDVFTDPGRLRSERMFRSGEFAYVYYYRYEPQEIWGLTARIIKDFLEALQWIRQPR